MAHRFRVYEVSPEGKRSDTGITILVDELPTFDVYGDFTSRGDAVNKLCALFKSTFAPQGFSQYVHYWKPRKPQGSKHKEGDIEIIYDFGVGHDGVSTGKKAVFFLDKGG